jgi:outer membrane cobalamin receptor
MKPLLKAAGAAIPVTIAAMAFAAPVSGQGSGGAGRDTSRVLPLDEIVVTATRTGQAVRDMPLGVTVLTRAQIETASSLTLPDLLRTIPGITTRDYQGSVGTHPTRMAPSLRGLGGGTAAGRTLVLLDGMPVADPFAGWVHWAIMPLGLVERVEIVRGGGSGIWGSRAMGGVINVITSRPRETGGTVAFEGGSMSTARGSVNMTHRSGKLGLAVAADAFTTDGFVGVEEALRGPIDEAAGSRDIMGYARLEYDASPAVRLYAAGSYLDEDRAWGTALRRNGIRLGWARAGARLDTDFGELGFDVFGSDQTFNSTFTTETLDRTTEEPSLDQYDVPARSLGANVQWSSHQPGAQQLTVGADILSIDGEVNEDFLLVQGDFVRRRRIAGSQLLGGIYVQDVVHVGDAWRFVIAGRWDSAEQSDGSRRETDKPTDSVVIDSAYAGTSESTINFSAGVKHDLNDRLSWRTNVYRAFRAPTLNELYKPFREPGNVVAEANSALESEHVTGAEIGADLTLSPDVLVRITGFWARVENPIVEATIDETGAAPRVIPPCGFVPANGVCRQRRNLDLFRSAGLEAEIEATPAAGWLVRGSWTYNPTEVLEADDHPDLVGNRGSRTPLHSATASVAFDRPSLFGANLTGRYVGERFEDDLNQFAIDSFFLLDARVEKRLLERWTVSLTVENLFDEEYVTARPSSGLNRVGAPRTVLAGMRVRW